MSGHSKFHTIAKKKGAADSQRAVVFAKFGKTIAVAARSGGSDPTFNFQLRMAIDAAKAVNMPKENIDRAVKRGSGEDGIGQIDEVIYEGFGPGGSAILVKCLTDNRNRSVAEVKHITSKNGGVIGAQGSVMWMFEKKGVVTINATLPPLQGGIEGGLSRDAFELAMIDAGAEDIQEEDDIIEVVSAPDGLKRISDAVESLKIKPAAVEIVYLPKEQLVITDPPIQAELEKLLDALNDLEDVDQVYINV